MSIEWRNPRKITTRIVIKAELVLQTPAHFGNGDVEPFSHTDMMLLRDPVDNRPLLPGASITGALRNYLRDHELGYCETESPESSTVALFGGSKQYDDGLQSPLIIYDSLALSNGLVELRDGVRINPKTRTAEDKAKFDLEVLPMGTIFPLHLELVVEHGERDKLVKALVTTLQGLANEAIYLGARKKRGLGRVKAQNWQIWEYDLTQPRHLIAWLASEQLAEKSELTTVAVEPKRSLTELYSQPTIKDVRQQFTIEADFSLDGSILVRSNVAELNGPDMEHLTAHQPDSRKIPIVPGTSLAGVIRARALRIVNTLFSDDHSAENFINHLFGYDGRDKAQPQPVASRVIIDEKLIKPILTNPINLVQNRVKIDRFTGGSYPGALFNQQPVWGQPKTSIKLRLRLLNPQPAEVGLLLQVLKDLWVGDLPLGGESSVGRGRLQGKAAVLTWQHDQPEPEKWVITRKGEELKIDGDKQRLEAFATALLEITDAKTAKTEETP